MIRYPRPRDLYGEPLVLNPFSGSSTREAFIAVDRDGNIVSVSGTVDEAIHDLRVVSPGDTIVEPELDGSEGGGDGSSDLIINPAGPEAALAWTGLPTLDLKRDVLDKYTPEKAHAELMEFFGLLGVKAHTTVEGMVESLLTENEKTSKQPPPPLEPSWVMGLALMPAVSLARYATYDSKTSEISLKVDEMMQGTGFARSRSQRSRSLPVVDETTADTPRGRWTMCHSSSKGCREACLVRVARNRSSYNTQVKAARTMALLSKPAAFVRILFEAIKLHGRNASCMGYKPYVRLNVLSDIPWEVFVPGLFEHFETPVIAGFDPVRFYDYTKVAGRTPPANYDLTFSFSGENEAAARAELKRGHRVAVVFAGMIPKGKRDKWEVRRYQSGTKRDPKTGRKKLGPPMPLPKLFWERPVFDGDEHDVRPYNDKNCIIGLRWKTPSGGDKLVDDDNFNFVKRVYHVQGEIYMDEATGQRHREMFLVAAMTPDQTGADALELAPTRRRR